MLASSHVSVPHVKRSVLSRGRPLLRAAPGRCGFTDTPPVRRARVRRRRLRVQRRRGNLQTDPVAAGKRVPGRRGSVRGRRCWCRRSRWCRFGGKCDETGTPSRSDGYVDRLLICTRGCSVSADDRNRRSREPVGEGGERTLEGGAVPQRRAASQECVRYRPCPSPCLNPTR